MNKKVLYNWELYDEIKKIEKLIATGRNNVKVIQNAIFMKKPINISIKSTLMMCKGVDKKIYTNLHNYYSNELNGLTDNSIGITSRLLDIQHAVCNALFDYKSKLINNLPNYMFT